MFTDSPKPTRRCINPENKLVTPLTEEAFAGYSYLGLIQQILVAEEFDSAIPAQKAFAYEALAARHDFSLTSRTSATSQPDEATAPLDESEEG